MIVETETVPEDVATPAPEAPAAPTPPPDPTTDDQAAADIASKLSEPAVAPDDVPPPVDPTAPPEPEDEPAPDTEQTPEQEAESLGLKGKSNERFREMAGEIKGANEVLKSAGFNGLVDLPTVLERAKVGAEMVDMVVQTGMSAENYSTMLTYGGDITAASKGDRAAAERAFGLVEREYQALATFLGKDVGGTVDPLATHADLKDAVESGEMDRKWALQMASQRVQQDARQRHEQGVQTVNTQQHAEEQGRSSLQQWDQQMMTADPGYADKRELLSAQVAVIRSNLPPDKWLPATQQLYANLAAMAPAAPAPKPTPGPVRSGRAAPPLRREFDDPVAAMTWALANPEG